MSSGRMEDGMEWTRKGCPETICHMKTVDAGMKWGALF